MKRGPSAAGGHVSFLSVNFAVRLALAGMVDAIVTAPVCKQSWALAKTGFTGHTEYLRHAANAPHAVMLFSAGPLNCALVTEHCPLASVSRAITKARVISAGERFAAALRLLGRHNPAIAACALNPHAGDGGVLGDEEIKIIAPAIAALRTRNIKISGPLPADAAWAAHVRKEYDGILCMYHDQALAPLKLAAKEPIVHWTGGLPFLRTSPAHGTAFDIAGRNKASADSMIAAILFAARHARRGKY